MRKAAKLTLFSHVAENYTMTKRSKSTWLIYQRQNDSLERRTQPIDSLRVLRVVRFCSSLLITVHCKCEKQWCVHCEKQYIFAELFESMLSVCDFSESIYFCESILVIYVNILYFRAFLKIVCLITVLALENSAAVYLRLFLQFPVRLFVYYTTN